MREFLSCGMRIGKTLVEIEGSIAISASVGAGGRNLPDDVRTIQSALNRVPVSQGGPVPPLAVDGIVGSRTIAAIHKFQMQQLGWADDRVDTNKITIDKLRSFNGGPAVTLASTSSVSAPKAAPSKASGGNKVTAPPAKAPDVMDAAIMKFLYSRFRSIRHWLFMADIVLTQVDDRLRGISKKNAVNEKAYDIADRFFKIKKLPKGDAIAAINYARRLFFDMKLVVGHQYDSDPETAWKEGWFQFDPTSGNKTDPDYVMMTSNRGFYNANSHNVDGSPRRFGQDYTDGDKGQKELRQDGVYVATKYIATRYALATQGSLQIFADEMTYYMIHELAHFVGPGVKSPNKIIDHAYRHRDVKAFDNLTHYFAMRNADSYARFAVDAVPGVKLPKDLNQN